MYYEIKINRIDAVEVLSVIFDKKVIDYRKNFFIRVNEEKNACYFDIFFIADILSSSDIKLIARDITALYGDKLEKNGSQSLYLFQCIYQDISTEYIDYVSELFKEDKTFTYEN